LEVSVVRSAKRRKTVSARMRGEVLELRLPAWMGEADEAAWIEKMTRRFERRRSADAVDLVARAHELATRYDLPEPASIRWVDNQTTRWGSCTPVDGTIRISSALAAWPKWVLDFVVVHELAHLVEPSHGPAFQALVARYPKAERATGFLIAKGMLDD
jgi:predicted metal-dependent hydrolase